MGTKISPSLGIRALPPASIPSAGASRCLLLSRTVLDLHTALGIPVCPQRPEMLKFNFVNLNIILTGGFAQPNPRAGSSEVPPELQALQHPSERREPLLTSEGTLGKGGR